MAIDKDPLDKGEWEQKYPYRIAQALLAFVSA
jgi:hypothetical protein